MQRLSIIAFFIFLFTCGCFNFFDGLFDIFSDYSSCTKIYGKFIGNYGKKITSDIYHTPELTLLDVISDTNGYFMDVSLEGNRDGDTGWYIIEVLEPGFDYLWKDCRCVYKIRNDTANCNCGEIPLVKLTNGYLIKFIGKIRDKDYDSVIANNMELIVSIEENMYFEEDYYSTTIKPAFNLKDSSFSYIDSFYFHCGEPQYLPIWIRTDVTPIHKHVDFYETLFVTPFFKNDTIIYDFGTINTDSNYVLTKIF
ncbi:MAG: hypothetical protein AB1633_12380 [Elusimicrobiota bacterium]